ncbi:MAG: class I SAM-dependent methyltransferase [Campylobacteraceae bacterium]|jgi:ubiquinone/menaquinone biosynthesis C-methylase UbiE|nr:class I SAM-dependent methyltransferase [Campylobacteraceae bacterium]
MLHFDFKPKDKGALDAQYEAQKIAFAPIIFQCVRVLKEWGILKLLRDNNQDGLSTDEICQQSDKSAYAVNLLLESALSINVVEAKKERYFLSKVGYFLQDDPMTAANFDFNHYINYLGIYHLDEAIKNEKPEGLRYFGKWPTIYPALSKLPTKAKEAWFAFDHFYSDGAFEAALQVLKTLNHKKILDIGGNTGKFSLLCAQVLNESSICIVDLPEQIALAKNSIKNAGLDKRITTFATDILSQTALPKGYDIIWMSQFLDCFSENDILKILKKVCESLGDDSRVCILEPIWDRQRFETSAFCIINTSPYFAAMANGKSKMFKWSDLKKSIEKSSLEIEQIYDNLGFAHSLIICKKTKD